MCYFYNTSLDAIQSRLMQLRSILALIASVVFGSFACGSKSAEMPSTPVSRPQGATKASAGASTVTGKLKGIGAGAVVVLAPADGREVPPPAAPKTMDQSGYEFLPALLIAQQGQTVQFRNSEDVLHNVRVTEVATETPVFNVATIAFGSYDYKFERPGFYTVTCDIHSTMRADILVTPTPYTAEDRRERRLRHRECAGGKLHPHAVRRRRAHHEIS